MRRAGSPMSLEAALRDLKHDSPDVRVRAVDALAQTRQEDAARAGEALRPLLRDPHAHVRYAAGIALGDLAHPQALDDLLALLQGETESLPRQAAVVALGQLGDPKAADALLEALSGGAADLRFQAASALALVAPELARGPLREALRDEDAEVRASAAAALGDLDDRAASDALAAALQDENVKVRAEAAVALSRLGDRRGNEVLSQLLDDPEWQHLAAERLFRLPSKGQLLPLTRLTRGWLTSGLLKVWAAGALVKLGEPAAKEQLSRALGSWRTLVRATAIEVLGELIRCGTEVAWARETLERFRKTRAARKWQEELEAALAGEEAEAER